MKIPIELIMLLIITIFFCLIGHLAYGDDYIGEVWSLRHANGHGEYIVDTSVGLCGDIGLYILDNNLTYEKYVYVKHNPKGKIIKYETADTMDEIIGKQNDNAIENKKMKKFNYTGGGKSFQAMRKDWKEGKDLAQQIEE